MSNGHGIEEREKEARSLTEIARASNPGIDVQILWDQMWVFRVGPYYFVYPPDLRTKDVEWNLLRWLPERRVRDSANWLHLYQPQLGDVIVDIGAGQGGNVLSFSRAVGSTGQVWAIEAHPVSVNILKKFCALNKLSNVRVLQYACVDRPSDVWIESREKWNSNTVFHDKRHSTDVLVKGVPFDQLADDLKIDRIDFLTMNIEGAERLALIGCRRALERARFVSIGAHDFRADRGEGEAFRTFDFVSDTLLSAGFTVTTRKDHPRPGVSCHVHAKRS